MIEEIIHSENYDINNCLKLKYSENKLTLIKDGLPVQTLEEVHLEIISQEKYKNLIMLFSRNTLDDNNPGLLIIENESKMGFFPFKTESLPTPINEVICRYFFYVPKFESLEAKITAKFNNIPKFYTLRILNIDSIFHDKTLIFDFFEDSDFRRNGDLITYFKYSGFFMDTHQNMIEIVKIFFIKFM